MCVCEIRDKAVHYRDHYIVFLGIQSSIRHNAGHQSCVRESVQLTAKERTAPGTRYVMAGICCWWKMKTILTSHYQDALMYFQSDKIQLSWFCLFVNKHGLHVGVMKWHFNKWQVITKCSLLSYSLSISFTIPLLSFWSIESPYFMIFIF